MSSSSSYDLLSSDISSDGTFYLFITNELVQTERDLGMSDLKEIIRTAALLNSRRHLCILNNSRENICKMCLTLRAEWMLWHEQITRIVVYVSGYGVESVDRNIYGFYDKEGVLVSLNDIAEFFPTTEMYFLVDVHRTATIQEINQFQMNQFVLILQTYQRNLTLPTSSLLISLSHALKSLHTVKHVNINALTSESIHILLEYLEQDNNVHCVSYSKNNKSKECTYRQSVSKLLSTLLSMATTCTDFLNNNISEEELNKYIEQCGFEIAQSGYSMRHSEESTTVHCNSSLSSSSNFFNGLSTTSTNRNNISTTNNKNNISTTNNKNNILTTNNKNNILTTNNKNNILTTTNRNNTRTIPNRNITAVSDSFCDKNNNNIDASNNYHHKDGHKQRQIRKFRAPRNQ